MKQLMRVESFAREEDGVTVVEYAFIALLVALAILVGITEVGQELATIFGKFHGYFRTS